MVLYCRLIITAINLLVRDLYLQLIILMALSEGILWRT